MRARWIGVVLVSLALGCGSNGDHGEHGDAGDPPDLGVDLGAGTSDALAPPDLGPSFDFAVDPGGPWPKADLTTYGAANGLSGPIIDASPDGAQNIWAATPDGLYLLRPHQARFQRFDAKDGLHIAPFTGPDGEAEVTSITAIAGGGPNEVFVGYQGYESDAPFNDTEAERELGNADRVTVDEAGRLAIVRYLFRCDYESSTCWEDRSPRRMIYAQTGVAAGHLFIGFNHGVSHVFADQFGDHVHPETYYIASNGASTLKLGEWYGLALTPTGDLWMGGKCGVGLQPWNPVPHFKWVDGRMIYAFTIYTPDHGLQISPSYLENERGIAVTSDGTVWFASLTHGLASWNPQASHGNYTAIRTWGSADGLPTDLVDLAADPDGTLWLATSGGALYRFDPARGTVQPWPGVSGVRRINLDTTVSPRALYVAMDAGLAVIRAK